MDDNKPETLEELWKKFKENREYTWPLNGEISDLKVKVRILEEKIGGLKKQMESASDAQEEIVKAINKALEKSSKEQQNLSDRVKTLEGGPESPDADS